MTAYAIGYYDQEQIAQRARERVAHDIDRDEQVYVVSNHSLRLDRDLRSPDELGSWLQNHGVAAEEARFYADSVKRGGNLVISVLKDEHLQPVLRHLEELEPEDLPRRKQRWHEQTTGAAEPEPTTAETSGRVREEIRAPVVEEELELEKRTVDTGGVRVTQRTVEQPIREQVELTEERIEVERRPADRPAGPEDRPFEDRSLEMREQHEEVVVHKEPRVTEEVVVSKERETRPETIEERLRRTDIEIERLTATDFAEHHRQTYGEEASFDQRRPAYEYGYRVGADEQAEDDFEKYAGAMADQWEKAHGRGTFAQVKEAMRHGFEAGQRGRR